MTEGARSARAAAAVAVAAAAADGPAATQGGLGRAGIELQSLGSWDRGAAKPGSPEECERPGGGAMPLAQLKEPWPLMELVPLDPEVSERGGGRAPAAG